ncbi:uncharacterized protein LOC110880466 [Helianthus annuus]|uniref:uncharacterized protein LOC110880466 n=1 Tax=Helianthus annuus TaxID=4232 RepID=UPI000B8F4DB4|nr:uncharacterized protein LOC110880466 [Helianthus annuus]
MCKWCDSNEEIVDHILTGCNITAAVWEGISRWCRIPEVYAFDVKDLVGLQEHCDGIVNKKLVLHGIFIIVCWHLWRARNEKVFSNRDIKVSDIVADVKSLGFLWYKHRFKKGSVGWDRWCLFDVM